jgi:HK97 family phage major capsid protein
MQIDEIVKNIGDLTSKYDELNKKSSVIDQLQAAISRPTLGQIEDSLEDYEPDFNSYVRKGSSEGLEFKSLNSSKDEEGGFLVSNSIYKIIKSNINNQSLMRKLASIDNISSNSLDLIEEAGSTGSGWVNEMDSRNETSNKSFNKKTIITHEMYAQPKATQKLLDDSSINIEKWLAEKIAESFTNLESSAFFNANGSECPRGVLTYSSNDIETIKMTEQSLNYDNLMDLIHSLSYEYRTNASFVAHPQTICELMKIKDKSSGRYLWSPSLESGKPNMLFGLPIYEDRNMPQIVKGQISVVLADFKKAYKIVDRSGIRILRDPYTDKPFVKFYATKRIGGDIVDKNAVKYLICQ